MMQAQNSHAGSRSNEWGSCSMCEAMANSAVMFTTNDAMTTSVSISGVLAGPTSRMELRNVSMLHAQKNARPIWRNRSVFQTILMLRLSRISDV